MAVVPTKALRFDVNESDATPIQGAICTARLNVSDIYEEEVVDRVLESTTTDVNGQATLNLFPNVLGERNTVYVVTIRHPDTNRAILKTVIRMPDSDVDLADIVGNAQEDGEVQANPGISQLVGPGFIVKKEDQSYAIRKIESGHAAIVVSNGDGNDGSVVIGLAAALSLTLSSLVVSGATHLIGPLNAGDTAVQYPVGPSQPPWQFHGALTDADSALGIYSWAAGSSPSLNFARSNTNTIGAFTAIVAGRTLGALNWWGSDGSAFGSQSANIAVLADGDFAVGDTPGRIHFRTTPVASGTPIDRWLIRANGTLEPGFNNVVDIGSSGLAVRSIYWGTQALAPSGSAAVPSYAFSASTNSGIYWNVGSTRLDISIAGAFTAGFTASTAVLPAAVTIGNTQDTWLFRDAANALAQRSSVSPTSPQTFRIYNTFTDASNYERAEISWSANQAYLRTIAAGTGTQRNMNVDGSLVHILIGGTARWQFNTTGLIAQLDNTYDIGASGANRPRHVYVGSNLVVDGSVTLNGSSVVLGAASTNISRSAGALPAGVTTILNQSFTYSGDAGGTTDVRATSLNLISSGANDIASAMGRRENLNHNGTGTLANAYTINNNFNVSNTGSIGVGQVFAVGAPVFSSSGSITTLYGLRVLDQGHATLVGTAVGVKIENFTASVTAARGIQSSLSSGAGKHNLYIDGTAVNYLAGQIQAGDGGAAAPAYSFAGTTNTGLYRSTANIGISVSGTAIGRWSASGLITTGVFGFEGTWGTGADIIIARDAANAIGQRNGTSAQTFSLYRTYTDASNFERLDLTWLTTNAFINSTAVGSGIVRPLNFGTGGQMRWQISTTGHWLANTDNTYDIGAFGATRPRTGYFGTALFAPLLDSGAASQINLRTNNGTTQFVVGHTASAVNYLELTGGVTTVGPRLLANGTDTNVEMLLITKGTGGFSFYTDGSAIDRQFRVAHTDAAVNHLQVTGGVTGSPGTVTMSATGTDSNINVNIVPKGTGVLQSGGVAVAVAGKQAIPIPAQAMSARLANGCAPLAFTNGAANQPDVPYLAFDGAAKEYAGFLMRMPKGWNESTVTAAFAWRRASGTGAANVVWGIRAVAVSDNESPAATFGSDATVTDAASTTTANMNLSGETGACTIGGTPAELDLVFFEVFRDGASGSDTLDAVDAWLTEVTLFITTNSPNDA